MKQYSYHFILHLKNIFQKMLLVAIIAVFAFACVSKKKYLDTKYEATECKIENMHLKNDVMAAELHIKILKNENEKLRSRIQSIEQVPKENAKIYAQPNNLSETTTKSETTLIPRITEKKVIDTNNTQKKEMVSENRKLEKTQNLENNALIRDRIIEDLKKQSFDVKNFEPKLVLLEIADESLFNENGSIKNNTHESMENLRKYLSEKEEWNLIISKNKTVHSEVKNNIKKATEIQKYMFGHGMPCFLDSKLNEYILTDDMHIIKHITILRFVKKSDKPLTK